MLESGGDDASGAPLVDGAEVGLVTQAVVSPYLGGKTLGLAKVPAELAKAAGTKLTATLGGKEVAGEIVQHPVYDKERRAKGGDQGYGEFETGCRSPVSKRSNRNG